ncbi:hypothetical protein TRFO_29700 [Tritrichomonas foetus]|uniref:U2A'/phosphoprotein 32 family A C-terminal domain-containing protein n=1 Tax=Tritrichomonas foetus TaxID=1144522 RepID=A0A1J4JX11_9EUKA|nr:hypothetical protein TRFO_29700 [Tritrichomonas foetus]|eukprot:OHT03000.1 hypothetical protein TRFO_29700 [Tritrichomonas foetus]
MNSQASQAGVLREHMIFQKTHTQSLRDVRTLNMWGFDLVNVDIISKLENVETLSLSLNKISTLAPFAGCQKLQNLYLRQNCISNIHEIDHLCSLPKLTSLMLRDNPISSLPNYRSYIVNKLPFLKKLDDIEISSNDKMLDNQIDEQPSYSLSNLNDHPTKPQQDQLSHHSSSPPSDSYQPKAQASEPKTRINIRKSDFDDDSSFQSDDFSSSATFERKACRRHSNNPPQNVQYGRNEFNNRNDRTSYNRSRNIEMCDDDFDCAPRNCNYDPVRRRSMNQTQDFYSNEPPFYSKKPHNFNNSVYMRKQQDSNMLSAVLSLIPELSDDSLQVVLDAIHHQRAY